MRLTRDPRTLLFTGAIGLASLLTLLEASTPGLTYWAVALALYWLVLAIIWFTRLFAPGAGKRAWEPWMFVPAVLVLGTVPPRSRRHDRRGCLSGPNSCASGESQAWRLPGSVVLTTWQTNGRSECWRAGAAGTHSRDH
ncbi:hypothetical protein GCM10010404_54640 [Nonomuraea africana]